MALDGIVTQAIVHELQPFIGARVGKIYQPSTHDLIFTLRGAGGGGKLLLSANPTYPRLHLTERSSINPAEAPMFCMLMRKHCEGGTIESITQVGLERIIHITIRTRDELGDVSAKKIIIELMGRHSNIILTELATGTIIDGIHHVTPSISSYRVVMPGAAYTQPPQQHKLNPLQISQPDFLALLASAEEAARYAAEHPQEPEEDMIEGEIAELLASLEAPQADGSGGPAPSADPAGWLVHAFSGLSPLIAGEILYRYKEIGGEAEDFSSGMDKPEQLWEAFHSVMEPVSKQDFAPVTGWNPKGKPVFSAIPLKLMSGNVKHYSSISLCLEDYYGDKAEKDTVKQRVSDLIRFLSNERSKNIKKLANLQKDLNEAEDADQFRIWGELLFASLHTVNKGDKQAKLVNYYDENQAEITVPLDPLLSPTDNAQRYFKKYNKYKNSLRVIGEQVQKTHEEIAYMELLLQQLAHASLNDIEEIREELVSQGYLRDRSKKGKKKKKAARPTLQVFTSSEGVDIYVGKNNLQNEYVTNRLASPNDTWLHTKDIPGSHVVIRSEEFGDATLEEAAQLAAYYSQAKQSSSVPVDCTLIRYVRKPSGAKPGFVIYDHQRTLFVTPDEERIKQLPNVLRS
ncbi:serologically defined colon cancer antigen 1-like protein [Paenibacillus sp. FSL R7-269]|uniref:Rqc2 family fibronectin-binding protein n=1 Tax=Paenibacillus sp. FSL R7-269 TaxID=1226755 RepID=UPI0003E27259|nr:NFACT RNA binding domain-containing protein [Paenibacillus sp. FSL R7-269]ETT50933.1 serologically defined colon cancer antigen 1-like protein [Paenibacillus sp. FSL R7-269]